MANVVITGATGFVGGAAWRHFRNSGWHVTAVGRRPAIDAHNYIRQDLAQTFCPELLAAVDRADVVIHAAARSSPWGSFQSFQRDNVLATQKLIDTCEQYGQPKLIYISSGSVYYRPSDQWDLREDAILPQRFINHYARTKRIGEQLVQRYRGRAMILRPRAIYGVGDFVLFPRILKSVQAGKFPLIVRPEKPVIGDLVSIDHLVECLLIAAQREALEGIYNITDGQPVEVIPFLLSVLEQLELPLPQKKIKVTTALRIARTVELIYGTLIPWREPPITRFGVHVFAYSKTFDVTKMRKDFGDPKVDTQQVVSQFVQWVKRENPYELS